MTRKTYRSSGRGALISQRSKISVLKSIMPRLGQKNKDLLRSSCFRYLFSIPDMKFQGQLYNVLLRKLIRSSLGELCLAFDICGRCIDFKPIDFALLTGFKFNDWVEPPPESEIHREAFRGKPSLSLNDVVDAFNKECRSSGGNSHLSLQLALLVIFYGVLLVCGASSHNVVISYLHLADDINRFNAFLWGKVSYKLLVRRMHRAKDQLDNLLRKNKPLALDANDFVLSLQVWAYEVIPIVARNCGERVSGSEERLLRMLRWSSTKGIKFDLMNKFFLNATPGSLAANESETESVHLLGVDANTSDLEYTNQPEASSQTQAKVICSRDCEAEEPNNMKDETTPVKEPIPIELKPTEVQRLEGRVAELERIVAELIGSRCGVERIDIAVGSTPSKACNGESSPILNTELHNLSGNVQETPLLCKPKQLSKPLPSRRQGLRSMGPRSISIVEINAPMTRKRKSRNTEVAPVARCPCTRSAPKEIKQAIAPSSNVKNNRLTPYTAN